MVIARSQVRLSPEVGGHCHFRQLTRAFSVPRRRFGDTMAAVNNSMTGEQLNDPCPPHYLLLGTAKGGHGSSLRARADGCLVGGHAYRRVLLHEDREREHPESFQRCFVSGKNGMNSPGGGEFVRFVREVARNRAACGAKSQSGRNGSFPSWDL